MMQHLFQDRFTMEWTHTFNFPVLSFSVSANVDKKSHTRPSKAQFKDKLNVELHQERPRGKWTVAEIWIPFQFM